MLERLQKIIAHAGIASRRHAEQLILSGQVRVNDVVVTELGSKADPSVDKIEAAGRLIATKEDPVYLVLHKPPEVVSHLADPEGRRTLRNFLRGFPKRVYPVGALDYDDSGLVFLTNDGDLTAAILKGWDDLPQAYHVKIKGRLTLAELDRLGKETGVRLRTVRQPDSTRGHAANFWYAAQTTGGKLDILRRTLLKEMHPVEKVKRIGLGHLSLEGIPGGRYRLVDKKQADLLRKPAPLPRFFPMSEEFAKPARKFAPRQKPFARPASLGSAQRPFPPFKKSKQRPDHYTKFQRRPAAPTNAIEAFDPSHSEAGDSPRAPWLTSDERKTTPPAKPFRNSRPPSTGKPFRGTRPSSPGKPLNRSRPSKFPRNPNAPQREFHGPGHSSKPSRGPRPFSQNLPDSSSSSQPPRHSGGEFSGASNAPGKSSRPLSLRPKGPHDFHLRKPKAPR